MASRDHNELTHHDLQPNRKRRCAKTNQRVGAAVALGVIAGFALLVVLWAIATKPGDDWIAPLAGGLAALAATLPAMTGSRGGCCCIFKRRTRPTPAHAANHARSDADDA